MAGEVEVVEAPSGSTGARLRGLAAARLHVPAECQKLVVGAAVLQDSDELAKFLEPGAPVLSATLVVSLDRACEAASNSGVAGRVQALELIGRWARRGDEAAASTAIGRLEDRDRRVRELALETLAKVAMRDDQRALDAICDQLVGSAMRELALQGLVQLFADPDEPALAALCQLLRHRRYRVRVGAAKALPQVAPRGHAVVVEELGACLNDAEYLVREAAAAGLVLLADPEDERTHRMLATGLAHPSRRMREGAALVSAQVLRKGEPCVIGVLEPRLAHSDDQVREDAVRALGQVARRGDERSDAALIPCLADESGRVRLAAVEALQSVAAKDGARGISALVGRLQDRDHGVREAAVKALEEVTCSENEQVVEAVRARLADPARSVKEAAVRALTSLYAM